MSSTHNTQNDANHGVGGLVRRLRQSMLRPSTPTPSVNLQTSSVVAACTGGDLFIEIAAVFKDSNQKFLIDTCSMVSIIKPNLINTAAILPSTKTLSIVKGDSNKVHGEITLPLKIPSLRRCINYEFYVANVSLKSLESIFSLQIFSP